MNIDIARKLQEENLITLREHPTYKGLFIGNYSTLCQINKMWNRHTIQCRGIILDENRILGRPFKKFFNYGELQGLRNHMWELYNVRYSEIWTKSFVAQEKMDGSLIIRCRLPNGKWEISTRGSFESEQAEMARKIWQDRYNSVELDWRYTYLFEIIHPENRIVVKYDYTDLVLLGIINTEYGIELSYDEITALQLPFKRPEVYRDLVTLEQAECVVNDKPGHLWEGFVCDFGNGFRCKIKAKEYLELHRIVTNLSPRNVFEAMQSGAITEWLDQVPDEFYVDIREIQDEITKKYNTVECQAWKDFAIIRDIDNRKKFATEAKKTMYPHMMFAMFDRKDIRPLIWKKLAEEY